MIYNITVEDDELVYIQDRTTMKAKLVNRYAVYDHLEDTITTTRDSTKGELISHDTYINLKYSGHEMREKIYAEDIEIDLIYALPIVNNDYYLGGGQPDLKIPDEYIYLIGDELKRVKPEEYEYDDIVQYVIIMSPIEESIFSRIKIPTNVVIVSLREAVAMYRPSYTNIDILMNKYKADECYFDDYHYKRKESDYLKYFEVYKAMYKDIHENAINIMKIYGIVSYYSIIKNKILQYIAYRNKMPVSIAQSSHVSIYKIPATYTGKSVMITKCYIYDIIEWICYTNKCDAYAAILKTIKLNNIKYGRYDLIVDNCVIVNEPISYDGSIEPVYGVGKGYMNVDKIVNTKVGLVVYRSDDKFATLGIYTRTLRQWSDAKRLIKSKLMNMVIDTNLDSDEWGYYYIQRITKPNSRPYYARVAYIKGNCGDHLRIDNCSYDTKGEYIDVF